MTTWLAALALLAPAAHLTVTAIARGDAGPHPRRTVRAGRAASWVAIVVAALAAIVVALEGTIASPGLTVDGLGLSVRLDGLSVTMLAMIAVLAAVIVRYSGRYLDGDPRAGAFLGRLGATIASVSVLVVAGNLALLVLAWIATSLALHQLLLFYPDRRRAVVAARKKFLVARVGDVLLIGAAALLWSHAGTGDLGEVFASASAAPGDAAVQVAAVLLVLAAALKSAQFPTHGWLVEVMETPTPVSALLHAGILNAGPFLIIRMGFVVDEAATATFLLIAIGATTALLASVMLLTQPSVKVGLGYSSAAHMGFMLMVCGAGVYAAALLHLVAHSFYKAHAFLSSGSAIDEARAADVAVPARLGRPVRVLASAGIALGAYLALAALWGLDLLDDLELLALGAILVLGTTQLVAPAVDSAGRALDALRVAGLAAGVTVAFFTLETAAHQVLETAAPHALDRPLPHLIALGVVIVAFATVIGLQIFEPARGRSSRRTAVAVHLRNGLYANAAFDRVVGSMRRPAPSPASVPGAHS